MYLVNDTLDYFQIKSGKFSERFNKCQISKTIKDSYDLISL